MHCDKNDESIIGVSLKLQSLYLQLILKISRLYFNDLFWFVYRPLGLDSAQLSRVLPALELV